MDLLLEIGTEEIPSGYIPDGLRQLRELSEEMLKRNRISFKGIKTYGTPRRIVLVVNGISERQEDTIQEIKGPPKKVSFDKDGRPTKAAISFAERNNVSLDEIQIIDTPKGEYLFIKKVIKGKKTSEILRDEIPRLISSISWPKRMRWSNINFSFVRPIHWILCIMDGEIIPFEIARVKSGNKTRGHRFMSPEEIEVSGVKDYFEKIKKAYVIVDPEEREKIIKEQLSREAEKIGGTVKDDPELLTSVSNLVEYPYPTLGGYEEKFLELPEPVIITPMKEHQKYFPVYSKDGKLMPNFIAINNTVPRNPEIVRKGHERVLRARLKDAEFFFREDQKKPLLERFEELKGVIYHAELGTSYDKVERFTRLAEYICGLIKPDILEDVRLVCRLCKCDLVTLMVSEFPDLQGIMGREYARIEGYPDHICDAIYEHYLPIGSSDRTPDSILGAIVGVSDRLDTICAYFGIGIRPTGSADPFGLRRHAIAIIRIIEDKGWDISLKDIVERSIQIIKEKIRLKVSEDKLRENVISFFKDRYRFMMINDGFPSETVDAVISASFDNISDLRDKIRQIQEFITDSEDRFKEIVITTKRVSNILKKEREIYDVDEALFKEIWESNLWKSYLDIKEKVEESIKKKLYKDALNFLLFLKKPIDDLFDNVEIMTKDERLRRNRIGLVQKVESLFKQIADFSKFPY